MSIADPTAPQRALVVGATTQRLAMVEAQLRELRQENGRLRRNLEDVRKTERTAPINQRDTATLLERLASLEALMASRERDLDVLTEKFIEKEDEVDRLKTALADAEAQIAALSARQVP